MIEELRKKWSFELSEKLGRSEDEIKEKGLTAHDFSPSKSVEIFYSRTSLVKFDFAFLVMSIEKKAVAVFTEHYGYHEFSLYGAVVKETDSKTYINEYYEGEVS